MNIVVVGLGLIGENVKRIFTEKGYNVITVSKKNADINLDLSLPIDVNITQQFKSPIDAIIYTAFRIPEGVNDDNVNLLTDNIEMANNFISLCQLLQPKQLVNLSSIAVYANESGVFTEETELKPFCNWNCYYGISKINVEQMLSNYGKKEGVKVAHLRIAQLLDENKADALQKSFMDEIKQSNSITLFAEGKRESNFIYLNYLVDKILDNTIKEQLEGTYNAGQFQQSYLSFANDFVQQNGDESTEINLVSKGNYTNVQIDCSKLLKMFS